MRQETSQSAFLNTENLPVLGSLTHGLDVHHARHSGCDQPWQAQKRVDCNHDSTHTSVIVVCFSVSNFVAGVVDDVPSDSIVQKSKNEGQGSWSSRHQSDPPASIQIHEIHQPRTSTRWFRHIWAIIGPVRRTIRCTTSEGCGKGIRNIELFGFYVGEEKLC